MLSDSPFKKAKRSPRRAVVTDKRKPGTRVVYSDQQKIEAVQTYLMLGSINATAKALGIHFTTVHSWKHSEWWKDIETELRNQEAIVFGNHLQKIVNKSLGVVEERLEKGDWIYDTKNGELRRKPVSMKDAHRVASDLITKKADLTQPEHFRVAEDSVKEKLEKLAKAFEQFAIKQEEKPVVQVTDVVFAKEVENAIPEERKEGLQEGTPMGTQEQAGEGS